MERLLPRHMQIIYQINALHLDGLIAIRKPDAPPLDAVSLIDEHSGRRVRMGHLAFLGSRRVNGVSALHTELMRQTVFRPLHTLFPDRIVNVTNGISFRRWLFDANPGLTEVLIDAIGPALLDDPVGAGETGAAGGRHRAARPAARDAPRSNKQVLAMVAAERLNIAIDPDAMFDVHVKRIHEYKRQLLNILQTVWLYNAMRAQPTRDWVPRVKIYAGKAAASYRIAKLIIKLIHDVARVVNNDPTLRGRLKVVFLPDYNVSLAETIIPAADLSEQISTAGMEASGTGNMKLALNGALTVGTAGRRQRRIARSYRCRKYVPVWTERRGGAGTPPQWSSAERGDRRQPYAAGSAGCDRQRRVLAGRPAPLRADHRRTDQQRLVHGGQGFRILCRGTVAGGDTLARAGVVVARQRAEYGECRLVRV